MSNNNNYSSQIQNAWLCKSSCTIFVDLNMRLKKTRVCAADENNVNSLQYHMFLQLAMFCANVACSKDTIHVQYMLCYENEQNYRKGTV